MSSQNLMPGLASFPAVGSQQRISTSSQGGRNKEFVWVKGLEGVPRGVMWPAQVVGRHGVHLQVYLKNDHVELSVKEGNVQPFSLSDMGPMKAKFLAVLEKKKRLQNKQSFLADIDWASDEICMCTGKLNHGSDNENDESDAVADQDDKDKNVVPETESDVDHENQNESDVERVVANHDDRDKDYFQEKNVDHDNGNDESVEAADQVDKDKKFVPEIESDADHENQNESDVDRVMANHDDRDKDFVQETDVDRDNGNDESAVVADQDDKDKSVVPETESDADHENQNESDVEKVMANHDDRDKDYVQETDVYRENGIDESDVVADQDDKDKNVVPETESDFDHENQNDESDVEMVVANHDDRDKDYVQETDVDRDNGNEESDVESVVAYDDGRDMEYVPDSDVDHENQNDESDIDSVVADDDRDKDYIPETDVDFKNGNDESDVESVLAYDDGRNIEYVPETDVELSEDDDDVADRSRQLPNFLQFLSKEIEDAPTEISQQEPNSAIQRPYQREVTEEQIVRDSHYKNIYIKRYIRSREGKSGIKTDDRPYDTVHACCFCRKLFTHIQDHIEKKHKHKPAVQEIAQLKKRIANASNNSIGHLKKTIKRLQDCLRYSGDHIHNKLVKASKEGELLIQRKSCTNDEFNVDDYGPCPECQQWIKLETSVKLHQKNCPKTGGNSKLFGKNELVWQAKQIMGNVEGSGSKMLQKEVLSKMRNDEIAICARNDPLICNLGDIWLSKSIGHELRRGRDSSFHMRLAAKLLLECRKKLEKSCLDMEELLIKKNFDTIVEVTLQLCGKNEHDELLHPSTANKIGFDLGRLIGLKYGSCLRHDDTVGKEECDGFLKLMKIDWSTKVTSHASVLLRQRHFDNRRQLPHPNDIEVVATKLSEKLAGYNYQQKNMYVQVARTTLLRLMVYNRRRSGEIEELRMETYVKRKRDMDDVEQSLLGELTTTEKYLIRTQELMWIRGKRGKRVPVLIPPDASKALEYIIDAEVRKLAGLKPSNKYMFATRGDGVISASECISELGAEYAEDLIHPERLTSTGYRAYMATMAQCLGLKDHQVKWLCSHLGHTEDVHMTHYRFALDGIERVQLGKLLMLQDKNLLSKFRDTRLEDIQFEEILSLENEAPALQLAACSSQEENMEACVENVIPDFELETVDLNEVASDIVEIGPREKKPGNCMQFGELVLLKPGHSLMDWIKLGRSGKDLTGIGGRKIEVSAEELKKHNTEKDCWIALRGKVYNVSSYLDFHPGGVDELMRGAGKDATSLFDEIHKWVNAESMLEKCLVGKLKTENPMLKAALLRKSSKSSLDAVPNGGLAPTFLAPTTLPQQVPRFDWYQSNKTVSVVVYTKWTDMKDEFVIIDRVEHSLLVTMHIKQSVFYVHIDLDKDVTDKYQVNVSEDSGKVEIVLEKCQPDIQWACIGKYLEKHNLYIPDKNYNPAFRDCTIEKIVCVTQDTNLYTVCLPKGCRMKVPAGYHVHLKHTIEGMEVVRSYTSVLPSLTSENQDIRLDDGTVIYLMIKIYKDGAFTPWLASLKPGDQISMSCYEGSFNESQQLNSCTHLVMFAAGTGFTPMVKLIYKSLVQDTTSDRKVKLLFFNKTKADILWEDQLCALADSSHRFTYTNCLSEADEGWTGLRGRINIQMMQEFLPSVEDSEKLLVCVCGPTPFTKSVIQFAEELGHKDKVHAFLG